MISAGRDRLSRPRSRRAEWIADAIVHVIGVTFGLIACIVLIVVTPPDASPQLLVSLGSYAVGLLAMLGCSALYHLSGNHARRNLFRRLDHAAIFVMIAGTYTPFLLIVIGGTWGAGLLVFVWTVAAVGVLLKMIDPGCLQPLSTAVYLLLGWTILVAYDPLLAAVSLSGIVLLAAGGLLYSVGVVFYLWTRLPYHRAVWHAFVLIAAGFHYAAVLGEVVVPA